MLHPFISGLILAAICFLAALWFLRTHPLATKEQIRDHKHARAVDMEERMNRVEKWLSSNKQAHKRKQNQ